MLRRPKHKRMKL